ncbi:hypothetical protein PybrP1_001046 [[Pythium] brassicae (nom. inval.)]|nr:hypothetical protein PybrP1_001046 [[Pythium] brassicae (nom. inval.)]
MERAVVLNRVPRDKLPRVLAHVLDALAASSARSDDVFSADEKKQLCEMLALASPADVDALVALVSRAFVDAAHFGAVNRDALRARDGVGEDSLALLEKAWRKKGRAVAQQIAARHPLDAAELAKAPVLAETNWRLHVELGQSSTEKLDLELSHDELLALFQQLNAIQAELDRRSSDSATRASAA